MVVLICRVSHARLAAAKSSKQSKQLAKSN